MKKTKPIVISIALVFLIVIVVPTLLASPDKKAKPVATASKPILTPVTQQEDDLIVTVLRTQSSTVENVPLEEYVVGVVATEMPADFELEALKAQALSARTYIVKTKLSQKDSTDSDVTDSTKDQVYKNDQELRKLWGNDYEWRIDKIQQAVNETRGLVLTYDGQPITASFFSTSNGRTENSEDYWTSPLPYLRSVDSHWDVDSPKFDNTVTISATDFEKKLGVKIDKGQTVVEPNKRTEGNRVANITIGGKSFTGKEIREKLGLRSSDFVMKRDGQKITISTKGFGHGVGMSQYGANGMAKEGKKYTEIVAHYYSGTVISSASAFVPQMTARK